MLLRAEGLKNPPLRLVGITVMSVQSFEFLSEILQSLWETFDILICSHIPAKVCSAATEVCFYFVILFFVVKKSNHSSH